jgi:hypothetical protein
MSMGDLKKQTSSKIWQHRQDWISEELEKAEVAGHAMSDYALVLFQDMELAYCAGAWISVIIVSVSIIDAHLREDIEDDKIGTARLLSKFYDGENIDWLRKLRNKYVHYDISNPVLDLDSYYSKEEELEQDATTAIRMVIKTLFQNPFI